MTSIKNFTQKLNFLSELFCRDYNREKVYKVTAFYFNMVMTSFKPAKVMMLLFIQVHIQKAKE